MFFLKKTFERFSPAPVDHLSRSRRDTGRAREPPTPRRTFGPRVGSVAHALGDRSREIWQVIAVLPSEELAPIQTIENAHTYQLFCSTAVKALYLVATAVKEQSYIKFVWTTTMRVWTLHMRVCCVPYMVRVRVCRCVRICVLLRWNPAFQLLFVLLCLLLLPNHVACITRSVELSSSLRSGSHRTTAVARQVCVDQYFLTIRVLT